MTLPRSTWLAGLAVLALAAVVLSQLRVVLDISLFMLEGGATKQVRISQQIAKSDLTRTLIVVVEAPDTARAVEAGRALEGALRDDPEIMSRLARLDSGPPKGFEEAIWRLYEPRTLGFVAASTTAAAAAMSEPRLAAAFDELIARLRSPMSTLVARVAPADPLLVLPRLFERVSASRQGGLRLVDGRYVAKNGLGAVLFLQTRASAFNGGAHGPLLEAIQAAFERINAGDLRLRLGGLHRFAVKVERSIKADITRVSVLSTVGLLLLFLLLFRSLRVVGLTLCILSVGLICGLAASLFVFGRVHGLTLAFGASMIGVSIDYSVHFFVHHTLFALSCPPAQTLRRIWPGLTLGAATTVAGFAGLAGAGLPGLREVALFASTGILGALAATWLFLPQLVSSRPYDRLAVHAARWLGAAASRLAEARAGILWAVIGAVALAAVLGVPAAHWDDDVARLTHLDPVLVEEEEAIRSQIAPFEQRRFVLAEGDTLEAALRVNERMAAALDRAVEAGELIAFRSLAPLLPSAETQRRVGRAVRQAADPRVIDSVAEARGFRTGAFDPFVRRLESAPLPPLTLDRFAGTPLETLASSFVIRLDSGRTAVLTYLIGVREPEALAKRAEAIEGGLWFDQSALYAEANRTYRRRTLVGLAVGLLVVVILVAGRYRRPGVVAAALAPAGMSVMLTVGCLGIFGLPLNIVGLTALLMVFSMGVDYGVFLAEAGRSGWEEDTEEIGATLLAVVIAWASTLLGFGLLALSAHPAMRTIGVTASIGVTGSLLLAPTALALTGRRRRAE